MSFASSPAPPCSGLEISYLRSGGGRDRHCAIHFELSLLAFSRKAFLLKPKALIQMNPFHYPSHFIRYVQKYLNPNLGSGQDPGYAG